MPTADTGPVEQSRCPPSPLPLTDPNHRYRFISVTALADDVWIDSVGVRFPEVESCVVYADTIENADLDPNDPRATELLWEPDAMADGMCDEDLAHPLFEAGDAVWVIIPANILEGAVVEVHEVRACQDPARAPRFEVGVHQDLDDPGRVVGIATGPTALLELPLGFYE